MGSIYKRGDTFWIKYYRNGKPYRESTRSKKEADAKRLLKKREGEIAGGKLPGIYFDKVRFDDLAEDFLTDYRVNKRKSLDRAELSVSHLKKVFESVRATDIVTPSIQRYIEMRIGEGAANATINRELAALKRILILGKKHTPPKVDLLPHIPMLKESNVRKGFFEYGEYLALVDRLPDYLKPFVMFAYKTGWRDTEIADLTWAQVDLDQGIVRLEPGETKNDEGRTIYLDSELKDMFCHQAEKRKRSKTLTVYVFPGLDGMSRIGDFRKTWNTACRNAELGYGYKISRDYVKRYESVFPAGPLLHDFRRTAARNLVRAGVPERIAMMVTGHKTRSVFDRYNIVNSQDLQLAAQKQQAYLEAQMGTISGTVVDFANKKEAKIASKSLK
jgi:integrase